jgi:hypothetical protein
MHISDWIKRITYEDHPSDNHTIITMNNRVIGFPELVLIQANQTQQHNGLQENWLFPKHSLNDQR